jgi:hypothetical protein
MAQIEGAGARQRVVADHAAGCLRANLQIGSASTPARWERGEREPTGAFAMQALRFVAPVEATWSPTAARSA